MAMFFFALVVFDIVVGVRVDDAESIVLEATKSRPLKQGASSRSAIHMPSSVRGEKLDHEYIEEGIVHLLRCVDCITKAGKRDYVISEGTLMGTARNGFLMPWDADADILFDPFNADNKDQMDFDGFYRLFHGNGDEDIHGTKCSGCGNVSMKLMVPGEIFKALNADGKPIDCWQNYVDMLSGNFFEKGEWKDPVRRQIPEDVRKNLSDRVKNEWRIARLFPDSDHASKPGSYIDVAPWLLKANTTEVDLPEGTLMTVDIDVIKPLKRCVTRAFTSNNTLTTLNLSCPASPRRYLEARYGADYLKPPYNEFDSKWVQKSGGNLTQFVRGNYSGHYSGPLDVHNM